MSKLSLSRFSRLAFIVVSLEISIASALLANSLPKDVGPEHRWLGSDGTVLPFSTDEDVLGFLSEAEVITTKELTGGSNRPLKMRLRRGAVEANAIFRVVDLKLKRAKLEGKLVADFQDSYIFECAAYELSRLLGINNVPPCIERTYKGAPGTLQLWIENAQTEFDRRASGDDLPSIIDWLREKQTMRLFDILISNFDRNQGNMLTDSAGKLWFIDHTRSFRKNQKIEKIDSIVWCKRDVWERMIALDEDTLRDSLGRYLSPLQIKPIIKRRDLVVSYLEGRMDELGEESVLYEDGSDVDPGTVLEAEGIERSVDYPLTSSMPILVPEDP